MEIRKDNWNKVKLGEIYKITSGGTPSKSKSEYYRDGTIPWVRTADLKEKYLTHVDGRITERALEETSVKLFPKGTVLIAMYGATIGACSILNIDAATNQACAAFLPSKEVDNSFLYYFFKFKKNDLVKLGVGGAQPNISATKLKNVTFSYPSINSQKQIVNVLDCTLEIINSKKRQLDGFENLIKSFFYEMFGNPFEDRDDKVKLVDACVLNPKKSELAMGENQLVSFVPMQSVSENGDIDTTEKRTIEEVKSGFTYFRENDVLFAKITPCMENGKGAIARNLVNGVGFGSTEFHVLRPIDDVSTSEWLYHLTSLPEFRKFAENNMTGSAGQKRVPVSFFNSLKVPVPPLDLQNRFAEIVNKIEEQKALVKKAIEETQTLFDSLMSKYFDD